MVSKSVHNLLNAARYIQKKGGEPALSLSLEDEEAPTEKRLPAFLELEEEEEAPKPTRPHAKLKNDELLDIGMEAIRDGDMEGVDEVLQELYGRSSRKAERVQAELEAALLEGGEGGEAEPAKPKFKENPAIKGEWGSGPARDILLSSEKTKNLLRVADYLMDDLPIEGEPEPEPEGEGLTEEQSRAIDAMAASFPSMDREDIIKMVTQARVNVPMVDRPEYRTFSGRKNSPMEKLAQFGDSFLGAAR